MINVYNILHDSQNKYKLNVLQEIEINEESVSIEESVDILNQYLNMDKLSFEHAYLIGFDNQMKIVGIFLISIGTSKQCYFHKKNIAIFLLLSGAERFILYHNHPDGNLNVSNDDMASMYYIQSLADILDIEFIESVIISCKGWKCIKRDEAYEYYEKDAF